MGTGKKIFAVVEACHHFSLHPFIIGTETYSGYYPADQLACGRLPLTGLGILHLRVCIYIVVALDRLHARPLRLEPPYLLRN